MISFLLFGIFVGVVSAVEPTVVCPAPRSPENGQAFLYQEGQTVKYVCEPGHFMQGRDIIRCVEGQWEDPEPVCLKMSFEDGSVALSEDAPPLNPRVRPLFSWGPEPELEPIPETPDDEAETPDDEAETPDEEAETPDGEEDSNSTSVEGMAMGDDPRRVLLYPRSRVFTRRIRPARIQRGTELEDEQKRRSSAGGEDSSTTIHLQAPPSYIYVRRAAGTSVRRRMAPLHMTVDADDGTSRVQVLSGHRSAVEAQNDKGQQTDEAYRRMYWWNHHYYPRQASLAEYYRQGGSPVATTLSESQIAWINSLHPEVRDQYLKDIYSTSYNLLDANAMAYYGAYGDPYYYYQSSLPYYREPATVVVEDPVSSFDYSCHQAHSSFYKAPKLPHAHIARYDRRQNPAAPQNHYLTAVYRCDPGYVVLDARHTELHCSRRSWVGPEPVCVPARG